MIQLVRDPLNVFHRFDNLINLINKLLNWVGSLSLLMLFGNATSLLIV